MGWLDEFISLKIFLPFIPLFVAFDALGIPVAKIRKALLAGLTTRKEVITYT
jgi:hypothetical protein